MAILDEPLNLGAEILAEVADLGAVFLGRIRIHVFENCLAAEVAAGFGPDDQRVGFDLPGAELLQIVLDERLPVVRVARVIQAFAAAGFQVVDPGQGLDRDEVVVQAEALDDQVGRQIITPRPGSVNAPASSRMNS